LLYIHLEFLLEGGWKNKRTLSRRPRSSARLDLGRRDVPGDSFEENLGHHAFVFVIEKVAVEDESRNGRAFGWPMK
jgi:hypothetical protein